MSELSYVGSDEVKLYAMIFMQQLSCALSAITEAASNESDRYTRRAKLDAAYKAAIGSEVGAVISAMSTDVGEDLKSYFNFASSAAPDANQADASSFG